MPIDKWSIFRSIAKGIKRIPKKEWFKYVTEMLETNNISGAHSVRIVRLRWRGGETILVIFGEVHENPGRCGPGAVEVVRDLIVRPFLACGDVIIIFETFFHLEDWTKKGMNRIVRDMHERKYPFQNLGECLGPDRTDQECIYRNDGNALKTLRMWCVLLRSLFVDILHHYGIRHESKRINEISDILRSTPLTAEEQMIVWANARIEAMDLREGNPYWSLVGFPNPFVMAERSHEDLESIREAVSRITPAYFQPYLDANPIVNPLWDRVFRRDILDPIVKEARRIYASPSVEAYKNLFVMMPDMMTTLLLLSRLSEAEARGRSTPVFIIETGHQHSINMAGILTTLSTIFEVEDIVPSQVDKRGGSCVRPRRSERVAATAYY